MGRIAYAEENVLTYLKELSRLNVCLTGLILGQSSAGKDYAVHLVRTPKPLYSEVETNPAQPAEFQSVKEIEENWITDHAKHVTNMLPGGMWVLGVFICSSNNVFSNNSGESKARSILSHLKKGLSSEPYLYGNDPSGEKILLHFNTSDFQYTCKSYDFNIVTSTFKPMDWKFQNNYTKWCKISCNFDLSQPSFGYNMSCSVRDHLKVALKEVNKSLDKAMVALNGQIKNSAELLETLLKNDKKTDFKNKLPCLKANIFMPCKKAEVPKNMMISNCDVELHLLGVLSSQIYLSLKTTVGEAIAAVKQDIIRSLTARLEMHGDSLVEEEYGSPEEKLSFHEPPRRVSVPFSDNGIAFSDYLFPAEKVTEVVSSFKEMLDLNISEADIEKDIEIQGDSMEFYGKSSINFSTTSSDDMLGSSLPKGFILFLFSSVIILIAIAIALIIQRGGTK